MWRKNTEAEKDIDETLTEEFLKFHLTRNMCFIHQGALLALIRLPLDSSESGHLHLFGILLDLKYGVCFLHTMQHYICEVLQFLYHENLESCIYVVNDNVFYLSFFYMCGK